MTQVGRRTTGPGGRSVDSRSPVVDGVGVVDGVDVVGSGSVTGNPSHGARGLGRWLIVPVWEVSGMLIGWSDMP